jgi:hypothetical protein
MLKIIESIENDISSLEERPVVELMNSLTKIISSDQRSKMSQKAVKLY